MFFMYYMFISSSDTQGWFRYLHQHLGQLARKALNLPPKIDTKRYSVWSNQIAALISQWVFNDYQDGCAHDKMPDVL